MVALRILLIALTSLICAGIPAASAQTTEETAQDEPTEGEWRLDWPREYTDDSGAKLILNQPQITAWNDYEVLHALIATVYTPPGAEREALGTIELSAITETDLDAREDHAA